MREDRDIQNLNNLSAQYNAGNQEMWDGISGAASGLTSALGSIDYGGATPQVSSVNSLNPAGATPLTVNNTLTTSMPKKLF